MTLKRHRNLFLMLLGMAGAALPVLFPSLGILQWVSLIPFFVGLFRFFEEDGNRYRRAYLYGFLTLYFYNFILYHWFLNLYPLDFAGLDKVSAAVVIAAGWLGLPLLQALPGGLLFVLFLFWKKKGAFHRLPVLQVFAFGALWVVWEWYSTLFWWGVPWSRLALGQVENLPVLQNAAFLGSYFISFLILIVNGLLAYALLHKSKNLVCTVSAVAILLTSVGIGWIRLAVTEKKLEGAETVRVAVIQGNISSHDKWEEETYDRMQETHANLTRQAVAEGAELILWAETALPYDLNYSEPLLRYVSSLARECGVPLIVGALYNGGAEGRYNALYFVEKDGTVRPEIYAKRHLVPFGEYVPMRDLITTLIPPLSELSKLEDDMTPGEDAALFETEWGKLGSLICFDSIYEELTRESVNDGAGLLLLSTNDSWFRDSTSVYMHQAQARLRAVESGRWVVRAANTGISTVTSPTGKNTAWIDPMTEGYAVADVTVEEGKPPYMTVGNLLVYLCMLFALLLSLYSLQRKWQNAPSIDGEGQNLC